MTRHEGIAFKGGALPPLACGELVECVMPRRVHEAMMARARPWQAAEPVTVTMTIKVPQTMAAEGQAMLREDMARIRRDIEAAVQRAVDDLIQKRLR